MLCCLDWGANNNNNGYASQGGLSDFPGRRRPQSIPSPQQDGNPTSTSDEVVSVTVPHGMKAGQTLQVQAPDGSGRMINATIPTGLGPGENFLVQFPSIKNGASGTGMTGGMSQQHQHQHQQNIPHATPVAPPYQSYPNSNVTPIPPPLATPTQHSQQVGFGMTPLISLDPMKPDNNNPSSSSMLLVNVPPGTKPGETLHVQVPGQSTMIAATVPPGVSQFYVSYQVPPASNHNFNNSTLPPPISAPTPMAATAQPPTTKPAAGQKSIKVDVPPGVAPGTKLHVAVPGEPDRVLTSVVPPNVREFNVYYTPNTA